MTGDIGGYVVITIVLKLKLEMIRGVVVILMIRRVAVIIIGIQIIYVGLTLLDIHPQKPSSSLSFRAAHLIMGPCLCEHPCTSSWKTIRNESFSKKRGRGNNIDPKIR